MTTSGTTERIAHPRRPQCSVYIAASLDGYIARANGGLDWLSMVEKEDEDYGYKAFFSGVDALVIGRGTYDAVLGFGKWPYENKRCIVLTHATLSAKYGEEFHSGDIAPLLERLAAEGVRRIYVDGGAVIREFLAADRIDDVTLSVIPVLLGEGIPLFAGSKVERRLRLTESRAFPSGLMQLRYSVEPPKH